MHSESATERNLLAAYRVGRNGQGFYVKCFITEVPPEVEPKEIERLLSKHYGIDMTETDDLGKTRSSYTISPVEQTPPEVQAQQKEETTEKLPFRKLRKAGKAEFIVRIPAKLSDAMDQHLKEEHVSRNAWIEELIRKEVARLADTGAEKSTTGNSTSRRTKKHGVKAKKK